MDYDDFRSILRKSGVDVWTFMDTAISVASLDYGTELKDRRDGIVQRLYSPPMVPVCRNCDNDSIKTNDEEIKKLQRQSSPEASIEKESSSHEVKEGSPSSPRSVDKDDDDGDRSYEHSAIEDEETKILNIREHLEDPNQSEDSLIDLLQNLSDMDITLKALKETDIGRHVNRLRKHSSNEVRRLVKLLVRRWKDVVDEWVKMNATEGTAISAHIDDGDSPQQNPLKSSQNFHHHQVPDFTYSPNPHNGSSGSDKNHSESEPKGKATIRRETQSKASIATPSTANASPSPIKQREHKDSSIDPERFASARRRLHENYQEASNAKKQRKIQVMDLHDLPKPKNAFFGKKGGFQGGIGEKAKQNHVFIIYFMMLLGRPGKARSGLPCNGLSGHSMDFR